MTSLTPLLSFNISIKSVSSVDVKVFLVSVSAYFKRSAPGAAKLNAPCALSSKVVSSPEATVVAAI